MIVEFVGLPAVGKSTVVRRLAIQDGFVAVKARTYRQLFAGNVRYGLRHPVRYVRALCACMSGRASGTFRHKLANFFLFNIARYGLAKPDTVALFDQGFVQVLLGAHDTVVLEQTIELLHNKLIMPDVVVVLEAPLAVRKARMQVRGYGVRGELERYGEEGVTRAMEENFETVLRAIKECGVRVVHVDATHLIEVVTHESMQQLTQYRNQASV